MALFTPENSVQYREMALAARRANRARRKAAAELPNDLPLNAGARNSRFWAMIAAIDNRIALEAARPRPNGGLMKDLAATRKTLMSQADGPAPATITPNQAPELPEPEQEQS